MHALRFVPNFGRQFRALAKFDRQEQARWVRLQLIAAPRATSTIGRINAAQARRRDLQLTQDDQPLRKTRHRASRLDVHGWLVVYNLVRLCNLAAQP